MVLNKKTSRSFHARVAAMTRLSNYKLETVVIRAARQLGLQYFNTVWVCVNQSRRKV